MSLGIPIPLRAPLLLWEVLADTEDHRYLDGKNLSTGTAHTDGISTGQTGADTGDWKEGCQEVSPGNWHGGHNRWAQRTK